MFSGSVACAFDSDDDGVVEEPFEAGRRDDEAAEDVAPFGEASVGGEDHRAFFATCIDDPEEQACAPAAGSATSGCGSAGGAFDHDTPLGRVFSGS